MISPIESNNIKIKIHKTTILPVVSYGYEISSLALTENIDLRAFDAEENIFI
jgi:hypothetical protein